MFDLKNKTALITGASGGIGSAIASALHGAGATVALSGTRVEKLEALARNKLSMKKAGNLKRVVPKRLLIAFLNPGPA